MFFNPETGDVSHQLHVVFDNDLSTVPFMREGKKIPNWTDLVLHISQSRKTGNIDLHGDWFTPYIE